MAEKTDEQVFKITGKITNSLAMLVIGLAPIIIQ